MIAVLEYKYAESKLNETFDGTEWENEWNSVQTLLSHYILANYTQILYIDQPGGIEYIYNQISSYINNSNITDGFKELYNILLKLPRNVIDGDDIVLIYEELASFFERTEIINTELSDALVEIFEFAIDEVNNVTSSPAEVTFWLQMREYINSLPLQESTRMWFNENFEQTNLTSFIDLLSLVFDDITGQVNANGIENLALLVIDVADKDYDTFGNFTGSIWPNNLIDNMNRIALTIDYFGSNLTENDVYQITNAVFISINDMFVFDYPFNGLLNITAQILPKIISPEANEYYFGTKINPAPLSTPFPPFPPLTTPQVPLATPLFPPFPPLSFTPFQTTPEPKREGGNPEEFIQDVLIIIENTLDNSMNMRDLIDTAQLYIEMNSFNETTFDDVITLVCDQNKDITKTLCTVLEMVNATVTLVADFIIGASTFSNESISDISNTIDLAEFLPFLSDFVDAIVTTFNVDEGTAITEAIDGTYNYFKASNITYNEIINLMESIGNLYLVSDNILQNEWNYTMCYVEAVLNNITTLMPSISPTMTPTTSPTEPPTKIPTKSPTETPTRSPLGINETFSPTETPTAVNASVSTEPTITLNDSKGSFYILDKIFYFTFLIAFIAF